MEPRRRVDLMRAYLLDHADEIDALLFGRIQFDLYAGEIRVRVERAERLPTPAHVLDVP